MPVTNKTYTRTFYHKHLRVACPDCKAFAGSKCRRPDSQMMANTTHIARVEAVNKLTINVIK